MNQQYSPADPKACAILTERRGGLRYKKESLKQSLRRYRLLQGEINELTAQLRGVKKQEEDLATSFNGSIEYMPKGKGEHADPTFRAVDQMIEVYQKKAAVLVRWIREKVAERARVDELMECLGPREREIIRGRYIRTESWTAVSQAYFLCERQCQRIADRALTMMCRRMAELDLWE